MLIAVLLLNLYLILWDTSEVQLDLQIVHILVRDSVVWPGKFITVLSCTYLLLVNLSFICIAIPFATMSYFLSVWNLKIFQHYFCHSEGWTDFFVAFPIAVDLVVPIVQVLQVPPHIPLHTQSRCQVVIQTRPDWN